MASTTVTKKWLVKDLSASERELLALYRAADPQQKEFFHEAAVITKELVAKRVNPELRARMHDLESRIAAHGPEGLADMRARKGD